MSRGTDKLVRSIQRFMDSQYKNLSRRYGHQFMDILEFPVKVVLAPFTLPFDIAGSAPRGFGVPEFISKLSYSAIFELSNLLWLAGYAVHHVQRLWKGAIPSKELYFEKVVQCLKTYLAQ